jgi:hypothetical protein
LIINSHPLPGEEIIFISPLNKAALALILSNPTSLDFRLAKNSFEKLAVANLPELIELGRLYKLNLHGD